MEHGESPAIEKDLYQEIFGETFLCKDQRGKHKGLLILLGWRFRENINASWRIKYVTTGWFQKMKKIKIMKPVSCILFADNIIYILKQFQNMKIF